MNNRFLAYVSLVPALALAACTGIRVSSELAEPLAVPAETTTWAFVPDTSVEPAELDEEVRSALATELTELGWQRAVGSAPDLWVAYRVEIKTRVRGLDPYFTFYTAEQVEAGSLVVELLEPTTLEVLWRGRGSSDLRVSGSLVGPYSPRLEPTDAEREWKVPDKVERIVAALADDLRTGNPRGPAPR